MSVSQSTHAREEDEEDEEEEEDERRVVQRVRAHVLVDLGGDEPEC